MTFNQFLTTVPRPVRVAAGAVFSSAVMIGLIAGLVRGFGHGWGNALNAAMPFVVTGAGLLIGTLVGGLIAIWLVCLGFVYADARQRGMPPVLWLLVAILIPNLLGFLLYFAMRRPLATACAQCGRAVMADQRFCAWCGSATPHPPVGGASSYPADSGLGPTAAV